jgi:3-hydroxybutyryl-CoA dehydratase
MEPGKIRIGDTTPEVHFTITNEQIKEYAEFSFDHNPLHVDEEFANKSMFKGIIAHGTIPLAYVYESIFRYFGVSWIDGLIVNLKLIAPVRPGDSVTCHGTIKSSDQDSIVVELTGANQRNDLFVVGEAIVSRRMLEAGK